MKYVDGIPRRNRINLLTPVEKAAYDLTQAVEDLGCDLLLTDAIIYLGQARDKIADFVEKTDA